MNHVLRTAVAVLALSGLAAADAQDDLKAKRDKKLAEAWVTKAPWITDYAKAKEAAKKDGKVIFAYFSRSYSP